MPLNFIVDKPRLFIGRFCFYYIEVRRMVLLTGHVYSFESEEKSNVS